MDASIGCKQSHGDEFALGLLLQHGAAVNAQNDYGFTPLHLACQETCQGTEAIVSLLLRWGTDETILNYYQQPPADVLDEAPGGNEDDQDHLHVRKQIESVHALLARAPKYRAWRPRGWLVMIRSRVWRAERGGRGGSGRGSGHPNAEDGEKHKLPKTEDAEGRGHVPSSSGNLSGIGAEIGEGNWRNVEEELVGLDLEPVFRTVVVFFY